MPTKKTKLIYLSPAEQDIEEIVKYHLIQVGPTSSRKIYHKMRNKISTLMDYPLMGQTHPDPILATDGYRKLVLTDTYVAIYKIINNTVFIYRIVNGKTDYPKLLK